MGFQTCKKGIIRPKSLIAAQEQRHETSRETSSSIFKGTPLKTAPVAEPKKKTFPCFKGFQSGSNSLTKHPLSLILFKNVQVLMPL